MKPTFNLRWASIDDSNSSDDIHARKAPRWDGPSYLYRLEQWWEREDGSGEWRPVPEAE